VWVRAAHCCRNGTGACRSKTAPQTVAVHPANQHRVISSFTAAEMRSMMQKVVLEGTGRKQFWKDIRPRGRQGQRKKVDPATGAYSKTNMSDRSRICAGK